MEMPSEGLPEGSTALPVTPVRELSVVFGIFRPPYVFGKTERGLDIDIAKMVLERKGYKLKILHSPNQRAIKELDGKKVDGVIGLSPQEKSSACYTVPFLFYDNVAISKAKDKVVLKKIEDLKNYKFVSFQKASGYLGKEYQEMVREIKGDTDISNQENQNKMFWSGKIPVIVLDLNVFRYYQKELSKTLKTDEEVVIHRIFPISSNYRVGAFLDRKVCDDFNLSLNELKASGEFQKIVDKYIKTDLPNHP